MEDKDKLKPCPFCGSIEPLVVVDDETEMLFGVRCFKCEAAIEAVFVKRKGAVDAWNRRANNDNDQILLLRSSGVHVRTDGAHAVHDSGNQGNQQEDEQEE